MEGSEVREEVITAGSGGQGVLLWGQILAHAAMSTWPHVSWVPSYSPEVRGGEATCTVVLSDDEMCSPIVANPHTAVLLNLRAFQRFADAVTPGGVLLLNSSAVRESCHRSDVQVLRIPADDIAQELGDIRITNMVMLGAYQAARRVVSLEAIEQALRVALPERSHRFMPLNLRALERGAAIVAS
jgi:2-oxoglutarate ferredoxin oxidoreductase subunit gamma